MGIGKTRLMATSWRFLMALLALEMRLCGHKKPASSHVNWAHLCSDFLFRKQKGRLVNKNPAWLATKKGTERAKAFALSFSSLNIGFFMANPTSHQAPYTGHTALHLKFSSENWG